MANKKPQFPTYKTPGITDQLYHRSEIPEDYHCSCDLCTKNFLGEIFHVPTNEYYTQLSRKKYYFPDVKPKGGFDTHICPGHWSGYRWAIQNLSEPGDMVYDPTVGTGTAIVEAINAGRNGVGIELEFPQITKRSVDVQYERGTAKGVGTVIQGDARDQIELLEQNGFEGECMDLIVTGSPYPVLGGRQSDSPERPNGDYRNRDFKDVKYEDTRNAGVLRGHKYWNLIEELYVKAISKLKPGGKFVTIIKDPTQNKKPYLLHKYITDIVMATNPVEYYGSFIHRHLPYTFFMNTYHKQNPDVEIIPYYQTGIVLQKGFTN
jgi:DNA modification methylase